MILERFWMNALVILVYQNLWSGRTRKISVSQKVRKRYIRVAHEPIYIYIYICIYLNQYDFQLSPVYADSPRRDGWGASTRTHICTHMYVHI